MLENRERWSLFFLLFFPALGFPLAQSLWMFGGGWLRSLRILYLRACVWLTLSSDYRSLCLPFSIR